MSPLAARRKFWQHLRLLAGTFRLDNCGQIRTRRTRLCPLVAVCQRETGKLLTQDANIIAVGQLEEVFALPSGSNWPVDVLNAADSYDLTPSRRQLRKKLLQAVGLKERKTK